MKSINTIIILIVAISAQSCAQANNYHPFPEDTAKWIIDYYNNSCLGYCSSNFYEMNGDTIINGQLYNKVYMSNGLFYYIIPPVPPNPGVVGASFSTCSYTGAIRQDIINRKVYFIDSTLITDTLLYDFNLAVGDTIQSWYNRTNIQWPLVVSGTDSVLVNNNYHKFFNFLNMPTGLGLNLIEGIGWSGDLFGIHWLPNGESHLACFNGIFISGGNIGGQQAFSDECSVLLSCSILTNIEDKYEGEGINLFPNPCSAQTTLQVKHFLNNATIIINNTFGQKLREMKDLNGHNISIYRDILPSGIYFIQLIENNESLTIFKLIIID